MKTKLSLFLASVLIGSSVMASAMNGASSSVRFHEPEKFTDFRLTYGGSSKDTKYLEAAFRKEIESLAEAHLPPGYKINIVFSDINMAGEFEPELGPDFDNVRIVKDIYLPRLKFSYEVVDESGKVVQRGEKNLTDLNFLQTLHRPGIRQLEYEFDLLDRFMRDVGRSLS